MATATKSKGKAKGKVKKAIRKVVHRNRAAVAETATPQAPQAQPLRVAADETFSVEKETRAIPAGKVHLIVNGQDKGLADVEGRALGKFVTDAARQYGIRNFSVYADGNKLRQDSVGASLESVGKIEIVAKDSRASDVGEVNFPTFTSSLESIDASLKSISTSLQYICSAIAREMAQEEEANPAPAAEAVATK